MTFRAVLVSRHGLLLAVVLIAAVVLRLQGIRFGLPALLDPDEPIFIIIALKLLVNGTLNPGWFGHPGSTTIYSLALVEIGVLVGGLATGRFADATAFATAAYHDPGILFMPGRYLMVAFGTLCVALTWLIARRLFDARTGLVAAILLAANPLHIKWSQVIRTDVHASVFMLLCILASIAIARRGRLSDHIWAGAMIGLAAATKWPSAIIAVAPLGAALCRLANPDADRGTVLRYLAVTIFAAPVALVIASPYLAIDAATVARHVAGEEQHHHLGATGGNPLWNLGWYIGDPLFRSFGVLGLAATAAGLVIAVRRGRIVIATIVVPALLFLMLLCSQRIIWARWVVPIVPLLSIFAGAALVALGDLLARRIGRGGRSAWLAAAVAIVVVPMLITGRGEAVARNHETRSRAAIWARAHIPPGSRVVIEHLGFDMIDRPWTFLTPAGNAGCVDAVSHLKNKIGYDAIDGWRTGKYIVDLGTIDPARLDTCRADYAILSDYDRYLAEASFYPGELALYRRFVRGARLVATFAPSPGASTGPIVRIYAFDRPQRSLQTADDGAVSTPR